jgi:hypothetical protein
MYFKPIYSVTLTKMNDKESKMILKMEGGLKLVTTKFVGNNVITRMTRMCTVMKTIVSHLVLGSSYNYELYCFADTYYFIDFKFHVTKEIFELF